jgi:hypothetical protein
LTTLFSGPPVDVDGMTNWIVRVLGAYLLIRGGVTLLSGSLGLVVGVGGLVSLGIAGFAFVEALLLLFAGGGLLAERSWGRLVGIPILLVDSLLRGASGVLAGSPLDLVFGLISVSAAIYLVIVNPLSTTARPAIDEEQSVHDIGHWNG